MMRSIEEIFDAYDWQTWSDSPEDMAWDYFGAFVLDDFVTEDEGPEKSWDRLMWSADNRAYVMNELANEHLDYYEICEHCFRHLHDGEKSDGRRMKPREYMAMAFSQDNDWIEEERRCDCCQTLGEAVVPVYTKKEVSDQLYTYMKTDAPELYDLRLTAIAEDNVRQLVTTGRTHAKPLLIEFAEARLTDMHEHADDMWYVNPDFIWRMCSTDVLKETAAHMDVVVNFPH